MSARITSWMGRRIRLGKGIVNVCLASTRDGQLYTYQPLPCS